jgi:hypothetical protein
MLRKENYIIIAFFFMLLSSIISSENIGTKRYDIDSPPKDLVWCGTSRETVLLLSENNSLYKSEDKGFNWKILNGILTSTGKDQLEENENEVKNNILEILIKKDWKSLKNYSISS